MPQRVFQKAAALSRRGPNLMVPPSIPPQPRATLYALAALAWRVGAFGGRCSQPSPLPASAYHGTPGTLEGRGLWSTSTPCVRGRESVALLFMMSLSTPRKGIVGRGARWLLLASGISRFQWVFYGLGFVILVVGQTMIVSPTSVAAPGGPAGTVMLVGGCLSAAGTTLMAKGEPLPPRVDTWPERALDAIVLTGARSLSFVVLPGMTVILILAGKTWADVTWAERPVIVVAVLVLLGGFFAGSVALHRLRFLGEPARLDADKARVSDDTRHTLTARPAQVPRLGSALRVSAFIILCALAFQRGERRTP